MNPVSKALRDFGARLKAATVAFTYTNYTWQGWRTDWTKPWLNSRNALDMTRQVGDGSGSSIVMGCVLWIARTFPEAPVAVYDQNAEIVKRHPMTDLIRRPNPYYSGPLLWMATLTDYSITGNAYWLKSRSGMGRPIELWYTPSWLIKPVWPEDGSAFISHYEYSPLGEAIRVEVEDVIHFRYGLNAQTRRGVSPLASVLGEIFTDTESATFTGTLLKNLGVPGVIIAPGANDVDLSEDDAALIKDDFKQRFSGDRRGEPMVLPTPTKVEVLSFSPAQMDLKALRRIPEERVSSVLGVPAIVAGLGAGLDRSTFANMAEAREMAYESGIIPTQRLLAAELDTQLLPDFEANPDRVTTGFDLSKVRVLQDDQGKLYARQSVAVRAGWITIAEARKNAALEVGPEHEVYYVPNGVTVTPAADLGKAPELPALPSGPPSAMPEIPTEDEPDLPEAPAKSGRKAATISGADEAERIYEERLRALGIGKAISNGNGRH